MSQTLKFRIAGVGLLLGSIALLLITSTMNWVQGAHDGVTDSGQLINGVGSVAVDIMGLLFCGLAVGICIGIRSWGWAFVFGLALLFSAVWSGYSVYSFRASEEISASTTRDAANSRIAAADKLSEESARKALSFARTAATRSARKDFMAGNQDAIKSFRDADVKVIIPPSSGNQAVADKLGWKLETVQLIRSAFYSFLIIFLKMIGFPGSGFLLSWSPEPSDRKLAGNGEGSGGKVKSEPATIAPRGENVVDLPARVAEPAQLQAAPKPHPDPLPASEGRLPEKVSSGPMPRVTAPAPKPTVPPTLKSKYASVEEYLASFPSVSSQRDIAEALKVSEAKVSRDIKRLKGRGKVKAERNGRSNAVTFTPRRNGGLHAIL